MVQRIEEARQVSDDTGTRTAKSTRVIDEDPATNVGYVAEREPIAERIVWFIASVLLILLAFRFTLALLGANPNNAFANFIYTVSHPFVAPFFNLFGYNLQYGVSRFETYTLVAMAVYAVVAFLLSRLFHITDHNRARVYH
ncbi:MAG: hypothetical protein JWO41_305 [Candidatus Saccharibacteria bacterium]|nr:hypothetical protein [Candidatus Saccharibacteria bacterium]